MSRQALQFWPFGVRSLLLTVGALLTAACVINHMPIADSPRQAPPAEPIRAVRIDFASYEESRSQIPALQALVATHQVNLVALGAGRPEWTFFKWAGHETYWSSVVRNTELDLLAEDIRNFRQAGLGVQEIDAVVDVYAPNFIAENPSAAAISYWGEPSDLLVSTAALLEGPYHELLLDMIEYIAANYAVDSISITELAYYDYGYGAADLALYTADTGNTDWPRRADGSIDQDDPAIGRWRSAAIGRFLAEAAALVHPHGKQLVMDVKVSWGNLANDGLEHGHHYPVMLAHADRLIIWAYSDLAGYPPTYLAEIATHLKTTYDPQRLIMSPGLWGRNDRLIAPADLGLSVESAIRGGLPHLWVTPSHLMTPAHWQAMGGGWSPAMER